MKHFFIWLVLIIVIVIACFFQSALCTRKKKAASSGGGGGSGSGSGSGSGDDTDDLFFENNDVSCMINSLDCATVSGIFANDVDTDTFLQDQNKYTPIDIEPRGGKEFESLAFITPWNPKGYNYSVMHRRFTYLSPVWFELTKNEDGAFEILGKNDVNEEWLGKISSEVEEVEVSASSASSETVTSTSAQPAKLSIIFPRLKVAMSEPLTEDEAEEAAKLVVELKDEYDFDGFVYESFQSKDMGLILAKRLKEKAVPLVFVMPALDPSEQARRDKKTKYSDILGFIDR